MSRHTCGTQSAVAIQCLRRGPVAATASGSACVSGAPWLPTMRSSPDSVSRTTVHQPTRSTRGASSASTCSLLGFAVGRGDVIDEFQLAVRLQQPGVRADGVDVDALEVLGGGDQHVGHRAEAAVRPRDRRPHSPRRVRRRRGTGCRRRPSRAPRPASRGCPVGPPAGPAADTKARATLSHSVGGSAFRPHDRWREELRRADAMTRLGSRVADLPRRGCPPGAPGPPGADRRRAGQLRRPARRHPRPRQPDPGRRRHRRRTHRQSRSRTSTCSVPTSSSRA